MVQTTEVQDVSIKMHVWGASHADYMTYRVKDIVEDLIPQGQDGGPEYQGGGGES